MRYCIAVSLLSLVLPVMSSLAAPAPEPYAILDLGSPPKGWSVEKHSKAEIECLKHPHGLLHQVWCCGEVSELRSVARFKDARPWLAENLRITEEDGGHRLRLTFRGGTRDEQVIILNTLLRVNHQAQNERIKFHEECRLADEAHILELEHRIAEWKRERETVVSWRKEIEALRSIHIPKRRAEIALLKQLSVIQWAK